MSVALSCERGGGALASCGDIGSKSSSRQLVGDGGGGQKSSRSVSPSRRTGGDVSGRASEPRSEMSAKVDPRKTPQLELPPRHWRCTVCRKVIPSWAGRVLELRIDIYIYANSCIFLLYLQLRMFCRRVGGTG